MLNVILSTDCIKYPLTGIGRYAYELAKELQTRKSVLELTFLHGTTLRKELAIASESSDNVQSLKRTLQKSKLVSEIYRLSFPLAKSFALRDQKAAIFHSPNYYIPPRINNAVATFHDLSVFHWPEFHPRGRVHLMQKELRNTVKRARVLITDSEYTRKELSEFFSLDPHSIIAAPLACNESFKPRSEEQVASVLNELGLSYRQFFLYTGTIEPRKNILTLLRAYDRLDIAQKTAFPLVISGYKGWENNELFKLFARGEREGWLKYLGFTPSGVLPALYSAARAFVFPSIYEGFGLPVLEAMASGTPVICSDATSLPEVVGDAALLHHPQDIERLKQHILMMIEDVGLGQHLSRQGLDRAASFSWKICADHTIKAYEQVARNL